MLRDQKRLDNVRRKLFMDDNALVRRQSLPLPADLR